LEKSIKVILYSLLFVGICANAYAFRGDISRDRPRNIFEESMSHGRAYGQYIDRGPRNIYEEVRNQGRGYRQNNNP